MFIEILGYVYRNTWICREMYMRNTVKWEKCLNGEKQLNEYKYVSTQKSA